ncbi:MAG: hypothetical protein LBV44_09980 [Methylobacillus sp.]|jgi:hypothetical protein|nr:hypothetical protein [Methylobacillus sp.]
MNYALHCHLLLPIRGVESAPLTALLRYARRKGESPDYETWLCARYGVTRLEASAAYAALGDGLPADEGWWFCADPVSLVMQGDDFTRRAAPKTLQLAQAQRLADALNAHFDADGMKFYVAAPRRWYLRMTQQPPHPPWPFAEPLLGASTEPSAPTNAELRWKRQLSELQMLLHTHPVNAELEAQGALPVNSVWLSGGGALARGEHPGFETWADEALPRGLALAHNRFCFALPPTADEWIARAQQEAADNDFALTYIDDWAARLAGTEHLVALPELTTELERAWLQPLLAAVREGKLASLTLHLVTPPATRRAPALADNMRATIAVPAPRVYSYMLTRRDFMRFWRRAHPLGFYLDGATVEND